MNEYQEDTLIQALSNYNGVNNVYALIDIMLAKEDDVARKDIRWTRTYKQIEQAPGTLDTHDIKAVTAFKYDDIVFAREIGLMKRRNKYLRRIKWGYRWNKCLPWVVCTLLGALIFYLTK